ncbi:uncharacterized protein Z520_07248 [Fonsecaea multimorphosa CBS 102226]|uniref:Uncharacterized protein n=1 Tax=Fonsecaea multimorphosa CBS 102226 TaxID=1442371 RepID=A0A0D2K258_9EURO|nr:uncharacterized protein Z520_07248 [Fonsecaea multimorphosa CBS 102226]KIX97134.1 hypothetical protein Z520_07248 [Fonsecaea multimorphosa CBS 102226]
MVYTRERLQHALDVYHRAWEISTPGPKAKDRHLRKDYQFRRVKATSNFTQAISWYEDDSSDEYCPTAKKRRATVRKIPKAKRSRHSLPSPVTHDRPSRLVTLRLKSDAGRALLGDLVNKDSTRTSGADDTKGGICKGDTDNRPSPGQQHGTLSDGTYLRRQDEESDAICGGTNRSGLKRNRDPSVRDRERTVCEDISQKVPAAIAQSPSVPTQSTPIQIIRAAAVEIQQARNVLAGVSRENPIILDSPRSSPELELPDASFATDTPWAHPINFKHIQTSDQPCHFCEDFRFGIFGSRVIGIEEITRMCVNCSLNRLHISRCRVHLMRRFANPSIELYHRYISQLIDRNYPKGPAIKRGVYHTCSLCAHPAFWRCCADQRVDKYLRKLNDGKGRGCGLLLCESCVDQVKIDKGVLKTTTVQEDFNGRGCQRADMDFLFAGSLLHKAWA